MLITFLSISRRCIRPARIAMVAGALLLLGSSAVGVRAADLKSVSKLAFGPDNVLFVADWKAAELLALQLPPAPAGPVQPFNLTDFDGILLKSVGSSDVRIEDVKARPGSNQVYVAVSVGKDRKPEILCVTADGAAKLVRPGAAASKTIALKACPEHRVRVLG